MRISPSMMCAEINRLSEVIRVFEEENVDFLHIDVMDGIYVPNYALGADYARQLRRLTKITLDVHLMVENPERVLDWFDFQPGEIVTVHVDACRHPQRVLRKIRDLGAKTGVALNPDIRPDSLEYVLDDIDIVTVMTVNPGFAGQKAIPAAVGKIQDVRGCLDGRQRKDVMIAVDGNVSDQLAPRMVAYGAEILVAGTSSFFGRTDALREGIRRFRSLVS